MKKLAVLLVLLVLACAAENSRIVTEYEHEGQIIKTGMKVEEIKAIMGLPERVEAETGGDIQKSGVGATLGKFDEAYWFYPKVTILFRNDICFRIIKKE